MPPAELGIKPTNYTISDYLLNHLVGTFSPRGLQGHLQPAAVKRNTICRQATLYKPDDSFLFEMVATTCCPDEEYFPLRETEGIPSCISNKDVSDRPSLTLSKNKTSISYILKYLSWFTRQ